MSAELADLRKALFIATAEIRYLNLALKKAGAALLTQHNHFRAMRGLPPNEYRPPCPAREARSRERRSKIQRLINTYCPDAKRGMPK